MTDPYEELRSEMRKVIGLDYVYISIGDSTRHFDPVTVVAAYASILFLIYIKEAFAALGNDFKEMYQSVLHSLLYYI